ncbi:MAG: hypothetical protein N2595_04620 [bacterium]|nr:hypothetical protein [bacterium]
MMTDRETRCSLRVGLVVGTALAVQVAVGGPVNDMFTNALALSGLRGETTGDLSGATVEHGEKGTGQGSNSVWWLWRVPFAGWYAVDTSGSSCDTVLGVWQGSNVATLTMIGTNDNEVGTWSLVPFEAVSAAVYYVQVSGKTTNDQGSIAVRWYPLAVVNQVMSTSEVHTVWLNREGWALSQPLYTVTTQRVWFTPDGYVVTRRFTSVPSLSSATVTYPNGKALFTLQPFQRGPRSPRVVTFESGYVMLRGGATPSGTQLTLNGVGSTSFVAGVSLVIASNFNAVVPLGRGVYITLTNGARGMGVRWSSYALWKKGWEIPIADGAFAGLFDTGFTMHTNVTAGALTCSIARKGRETAAVVVPLPSSGAVQVLGSAKGSVLTWVKRGATNGPMTLTTAKGEEVFSSFAPQEGPLFHQCLFDGTRMAFVYGTQGTSATVSVYGVGKSAPVSIGQITVPHFNRVLFDGMDLLTVSSVTGVTTVACYGKQLQGSWVCEARGGFFSVQGGGVFATRETTPSNDVYRVYMRDVEIGNHTFPRR